jgi:hypothetical protein
MSARRSQHLFELLTLGLLALPTWLGGQAISDELLTRAERSAFRETGSYDDVMALSVRLADLSDDIHLTTFGYTNEGRALPLLVVGAPDASPEAVLATGKARVYLQGNIHAGRSVGRRLSSCWSETTSVEHVLHGRTSSSCSSLRSTTRTATSACRSATDRSSTGP